MTRGDFDLTINSRPWSFIQKCRVRKSNGLTDSVGLRAFVFRTNLLSFHTVYFSLKRKIKLTTRKRRIDKGVYLSVVTREVSDLVPGSENDGTFLPLILNMAA